MHYSKATNFLSPYRTRRVAWTVIVPMLCYGLKTSHMLFVVILSYYHVVLVITVEDYYSLLAFAISISNLS